MLSPMQVSPNFGSTRIVLKPKEIRGNRTFSEVFDKYLDPVRKQGFDIRAAWQKIGGKEISPQIVADDLNVGEAGVEIPLSCDTITIYGKDKASDGFIGELLTKMFPENATFTENIK